MTTCTTCGQHYFLSYLKDFEFGGRAPSGGEAAGDDSFWEPLDEALGGRRVVLIDHVVGGSGDDDELDEHERTAPLYFCRHCGSAHPDAYGRCLHCAAIGEMVQLYAVRQKTDNPGYLTSCHSCASNGRRMNGQYREPARPVRATNVADVHVLAQDMIHHSGTAAAARLLRQPPGRRFPGRLDELTTLGDCLAARAGWRRSC